MNTTYLLRWTIAFLRTRLLAWILINLLGRHCRTRAQLSRAWYGRRKLGALINTLYDIWKTGAAADNGFKRESWGKAAMEVGKMTEEEVDGDNSMLLVSEMGQGHNFQSGTTG